MLLGSKRLTQEQLERLKKVVGDWGKETGDKDEPFANEPFADEFIGSNFDFSNCRGETVQEALFGPIGHCACKIQQKE